MLIQRTIYVASVLALGACEGIVGVDCGDSSTHALEIAVRDSISDARIPADVMARDGDFLDSAFGSEVELAEGRAGTYIVTVEADGYRLWRSGEIEVLRNECGLDGVSMIARLQGS